MKKSILISCLLLASVCANAQFEKGTWVVNPSITGLSLTHSSEEKTIFGISAQGGAFLIDNVALLVNLGGRWADNLDTYSIGLGGRYYMESCGIYLGLGANLTHRKPEYLKTYTDFAITPEVGYAFFISKTVTIEPSVYYDISCKDSDYSRFGLKVGFGIYF